MQTTRAVIALLLGLLFGLGLLISGMANPEKVLGFFNIAGMWDPSLGLVMAGAIAVGLPGFAYARKREKSILGESMQLPKAKHIDHRLIVGSALFGCGWGLAGICPGPGLVLLGAGELKGVLFVTAMLFGIIAYEKFSTFSLRT